MAENTGFKFLEAVSNAANPFNLVVENKLAKKLLAVKRPIHEPRWWPTKMEELDKELAMITKKGGDLQKMITKLPGFVWSKYPGEFHLPGHNYTGPGTRLDLRLEPGGSPVPKSGEEPINRVDAAAFRHDIAYRNFQDIERRHSADRQMIAELDAIENPTFREKVERMFVKKALQGKMFLGQGISEEIHKEFRRPKHLLKVKVFGKDNIWSADLITMPLEGNYKYCLTVIDLYTRYAWVIPLKTKTGKEVKLAFKKIFRKSKRKPRKLFVDKGSEFFNREVKPLFEEIYSTENEGKAVIIERFNRTLKRKLFKQFTKQGNQNWLKILDKIVADYNNNIHSSIGETPVNASNNPNLIAIKTTENNYKNEYLDIKENKRFKVGDRVRIFKWKNRFEKGYTGYWTREIFEIEEILNTSPITYKIRDLDNEEIKGKFYSNELQKTDF